MTRSAEAQQLSLGILARSRKANERRLPIHPVHFSRIDRRVRPRIFLEHGYGVEFGTTDDALADLVGGIRTRVNSSSPPIDFPDAVDRHHMRVVERGRGLQFTPETLLKRGVVGEMGRKHLQRDDAIGFLANH